MNGYNPSKSTWLNPNIEYIFNTEIIENDMRDAGFSLIKQYKLLPPEKIVELGNLEKGFPRNKAVGILQRDDKEFSKALLDKFTEIRTIFIATNELTDNDILSVKKDAIFTLKPAKRTKYGQIEFANKNRYTSYIRFPNIQNLEIYYNSEGVDIKGMSDSSVNRHRLYMIEFLRKVIDMIENHSPQVKRYLMKFIQQYKSGELDEGFYLEFNNMSRDLNPLFNYQNILIPLVQIVLEEIE